ncbi:MAG TPA: IS630 family transposase, partial [Xanthomonadaceae bacterium]|nr:IS630 family transposase [Xanthomonadaceae bacterium]
MVRAAAAGDPPQKKRWAYRERDPRKRRAYGHWRDRAQRRGKILVYADESGFEPGADRRHAYGPRGARVQGLVSGHKRPRTSLLAARIGSRLEAPLLFDGTCNTAVFDAWLARQLCPLLTPEHVVILDNAAFHKSAKTRELITAQGARLLFLPPYSPDLNPVERDLRNRHHRFLTAVQLRQLAGPGAALGIERSPHHRA